MKWWKPVAAMGALAAAPFVLPALAAGAAGLGAGAAGAGAAGAGAGAASSGGLASLLGGSAGLTGMLKLAPQAIAGYALGGPQGALTLPMMSAQGGSMGPSLLGGLAGRALGGNPGSGLFGMGLGGMLGHLGGMQQTRESIAGASPAAPPTGVSDSAPSAVRPDPSKPIPWWMLSPGMAAMRRF